MSYKAFKGKWQAFGDKPIISILSTGLICFNKACYDTYVKPTNCKYVKLYYEPDMKKVAFAFRNDRKGEFVLPVNLTKTGLIAVVNGKTFFNQFGIKYPEQSRSFPVHQTKPSSGIKGIEIKLTEYATA
ncbi:MAG: hypothetical protein HZA49_05940 [Planctomycetes bacterium]|nr:hypothetical protein [Planctomycetota bacterium]